MEHRHQTWVTATVTTLASNYYPPPLDAGLLERPAGVYGVLEGVKLARSVCSLPSAPVNAKGTAGQGPGDGV
jgi:hypothetical protein